MGLRWFEQIWMDIWDAGLSEQRCIGMERLTGSKWFVECRQNGGKDQRDERLIVMRTEKW